MKRTKDKQTLTQRQAGVLRFIIGHIEEHAVPPSQREIGRAFGIRSVNAVSDHLSALERKGYIRRGSHAREIRVVRSWTGKDVELSLVRHRARSKSLGSLTVKQRDTLLRLLAHNHEFSIAMALGFTVRELDGLKEAS